jgi:hypothetical protein
MSFLLKILGLGSAFSHPLLTLILFVALLLGFAALFARKQLGEFALGGLRALASLAYSPYLFMRKAVQSLVRFAAAKEEEELRSDTYLINQGLTILLVAVVLVGLMILAGGLAGAIGGLVPAKELRQSIAEVGKKLKAAKEEYNKAQANLASEQKRWERERSSIVQKVREAAALGKTQTLAQLANLQKEMARWEVFTRIDSQLGPVSGQLGSEEIARRKQQALDDLGRMWLYSSTENKLRNYIQLWAQASLQDYEAKYMPENEIGSRFLASLQQRVEELRAAMEPHQQEHKALWAQVWAPFKAFPLKLLLTVLGFLAFVWWVGTFFEWIGLFVRLADNVRAIREGTETVSREGRA